MTFSYDDVAIMEDSVHKCTSDSLPLKQPCVKDAIDVRLAGDDQNLPKI